MTIKYFIIYIYNADNCFKFEIDFGIEPVILELVILLIN